MISLKNLLLPFAFMVLLFACGKDDGLDHNHRPPAAGTWQFVYLTGQDKWIEVYTTNGVESKKVDSVNYKTTGNSGEMVIDADSIRFNAVKWSADTVEFEMAYLDGLLQQTKVHPYGTWMTTTVYQRAPYVLTGKDSIALGKGFVDVGDTTVHMDPSSYRFSWAGDTLLLTNLSAITTITPEVDQPTITVTQYFLRTMRFVKK